jgi:hypothetical protein
MCRAIQQRMASPGEINYPFIDPFTLVHAAVGVLLSVVGVGLAPTLLIATGWEVIEHLLKNCTPQLFVFPSQDTLRNALGDVAATAFGWFLVRWVKERPPAPSNSSDVDASDVDASAA